MDNLHFGKKVAIALILKDMKQKELAKLIDIEEATISNIIKGKQEAAQATKQKIADGLEMPLGVLETIGSGINHDNPQPEDPVYVPLFGDIPAGPPTDVQNEGYLGMHKILRHQAGTGRYVLRVSGDSMDKEFRHRDLILVEFRQDLTLRTCNNKICTVLLNGGSLIKRVCCEFKHGKPINVRLISESCDEENYPPIPVDLAKDQFAITGLLVEFVGRKYY